MTPDEARLLLQMRRPGERDADDATFAEALATVERDPVLKAWHEGEQKRDYAITTKLAAITPPAGLREAILAGGRVSEPKRPVRRSMAVWLGLAAAVVILAGVGTALRLSRGPGRLDWLEVAAARDVIRDGRAHAGLTPGLSSLQTKLAQTTRPLSEELAQSINLVALKREGCRTVMIEEHEMVEVCFKKNGGWFHVYVMPREGGSNQQAEVREIPLAAGGRLGAVAWSDEKFTYALVGDAGKDAMQRLVFL